MNQIFDVHGPNEGLHCDEDEGRGASKAGYSDVAIKYYTDKPYWGVLPDADLTAELTGTCGDSMTVYLKLANGVITDVRFLVLGCAGAISAAMALGDIVRGKTLKQARLINDGDVFKVLQEIPVQKHHCIQLAVKTLHGALDSALKT
ncbi:MAG: iron-sulfur cluster assembly scaffold protein [Desulfobacterales bacterium]|jgi:nitrogen fixation NifU-like protein|nr:iron-sulfur cluster assembly scaffold protein [Desulfobacterales bacterium]